MDAAISISLKNKRRRLRVGPPGAGEPLRLEILRDADLSSGTEHVVNYIPYNFHA